VAKRGKPFVFSDISHGIKEQKVVVYQVINQNSGDFLHLAKSSKRLLALESF